LKKSLRIGIVEDEAIIAQNIYELLSELGYTVFEPARNYEEGLELLAKTKLNLVLLDIRLGKGRSGIELANKINSDYKIPFIFLTANSDRETVQAARAAAPSAYLIKPFTKNDLYAAIEIAGYKFLNQPEIEAKEISWVFIKDGNTVRKISSDDIVYIESEHVYIKIHTAERSFLHRSSLQQFILELNNPKFIQSHRSFLVNMDYANEMSSTHLRVGNVNIPVSRNFKQSVQDYFYNGKKINSPE
jgi:DNA-binding LytR/AlgR family response regulator